MLDMTQMLRPFFWLMLALAAAGPLAILLSRCRIRRFPGGRSCDA